VRAALGRPALDLPAEYVRLGLALDRLVPGSVDAWTGPAQVRAQVLDQPLPTAAELAARAARLLAELPSAGLEPVRAAFLAAQLTALRSTLRSLAGEPVGWVQQVQDRFQVHPEPGDEAAYALAHTELDLLLPGDGPLLERYAAYRRAQAVPVERLAEVVREVSTLLRERTRRAFPLPLEERVEYDVVSGRPWSGFSSWTTGFVSRVAVNADLPVGLGALPALLAHEAYPGHHTERCRKAVRLDGLPERRLWLVGTPEHLLAEGLADAGLTGLGLAGWGRLLAELYADLGIGYDGELGERVARAAAPLVRVRQDAALLLHDRGGSLDDAAAYLRRWALLSPDRVAQTLEFLTDPLWRTSICTYVEGEALVSAWLAARPPRQPVSGRFVRLLDESWTPAGLRADLLG
jgi:hypothetical protein